MNTKNLLAVAALALAACTSNNGGTDTKSAADTSAVESSCDSAKKCASQDAPAKPAEVKDIALEVYNLISKSELPKEFRDVKRSKWDLEEGNYNRRRLSADSSVGECDHRNFDLLCYPIAGEESYKVYWMYEVGCDGSMIQEAAAYIYKDGKLTAAEFDLPKPAFSEFISKEDESKFEASAIREIKKNLSMSLLYRNPGMSIDTFKVYFFTDFNDAIDEHIDGHRPTYAWNGSKFEKISK
ncbi:MAG: hypothetical protein MJZ24_10765 [Paludibacteraceae bacterium]|nr:hypothetical protein [Paludibacteraceae bacterium]